METLQIARLFALDSHAEAIVRAIVAKDKLLTVTIDTYSAAFDTKKPGEHWIALYLDGKGRGEYFCSYGLPPQHVEFR